MPRRTHPWGAPPWTVDFRPVPRAIPERADFVIVGGGFSGLSAAAWLRRSAPHRSVLVLESASLGEGASGRTGGMALAETAAGPLAGLGDVLAGYKKILRALGIDARLALPGVYELARSAPATRASHGKSSPISWSDSGELKVVGLVPGGTVDPGKVLSGLARAAENAGAEIVEHAQVQSIDFSSPLRLKVRCRLRGRAQRKIVLAKQVLLATNAFSLDLSALSTHAAPKLTFALATAPLPAAPLKALGLSSRRPFYTVDFPYLWGRLLESNGVIFGAGLVPVPASTDALFRNPARARSAKNASRNLQRFHVGKGQAAARLRWLEARVRNLHPFLNDVPITHRWGGPILFTEKMRPIFRRHPQSKQVMILAGYNGHGVALSVYLGQWAAQALLARRPLPRWQ